MQGGDITAAIEQLKKVYQILLAVLVTLTITIALVLIMLTEHFQPQKEPRHILPLVKVQIPMGYLFCHLMPRNQTAFTATATQCNRLLYK